GDGGDALGALLRVEGDAVPHPELVAVGVGEPPHPFAGRVDGADPGAVRPVGHLALRPGVTVPRVDLPCSADVGSVDAAARRVPGPAGQAHPGGPEARLPACVVDHPPSITADQTCDGTVSSDLSWKITRGGGTDQGAARRPSTWSIAARTCRSMARANP